MDYKFIFSFVASTMFNYSVFAQAKLNPPVNRGVICWQEGIKLRWKDFEANNFPIDGRDVLDIRVGACCASEIAVLPHKDNNGKPNFLVESFFVKKKSWVRDSSTTLNKVLLAHEQLHFDINELFARKIRLKVFQLYQNGSRIFGPEVGQEINCLLEEQNEFNAYFDKEAHADPSARMLQKWQAIVNRELASLKTYKSIAATCGQ